MMTLDKQTRVASVIGIAIGVIVIIAVIIFFVYMSTYEVIGFHMIFQMLL